MPASELANTAARSTPCPFEVVSGLGGSELALAAQLAAAAERLGYVWRERPGAWAAEKWERPRAPGVRGLPR